MGDWTQLPLPKQSNRPLSPMQSLERLVNMRAHPQEGRSAFVLEQRPGLRLVANVSSDPVRGLHVFDSRIYAVIGSRLYTVSPQTGASANVGAVGGSGPVDMASNLSHVVICTSGPTYYTDGSSIVQLPESNLSRVAYQDGYLIYAQRGTENVFISGLDDATTISALDFTTVDRFTDEVLAVVSNHGEVWAVGESSIEVLANVGDANFPFVRTAGGFLERGTAASRSVQLVNRSVMFLGDDLAVYRSNGYAVEPVSTAGIEQAIKNQGDPGGAEAFVYSEGGRNFYVLSVGDATFTFNASSGLWNEESSDANSSGRWNVRGSARIENEWIVGSTTTGKLYALDSSVYTDDGDEMVREIIAPPIAAGGDKPVFVQELYLECDAGIGLDGDVQGSEPKLMLDWTQDGGRSWSNELTTSLGAIGEYNQRATFSRLGLARNRSLRYRVSDPVRWTVLGQHARLEVGL